MKKINLLLALCLAGCIGYAQNTSTHIEAGVAIPGSSGGGGGGYSGPLPPAPILTPFISTIAGNGTEGFSGDGGAATAAEMDGPWDIAFDASGNMYIADELNNRI